MEIWKPVPSNPNYEVSNMGRVKSLFTGKVMKPTKEKNGYVKVSQAPKQVSVHRLVAEAFIEKIPGKTCVNHKNGIKTDNRVENLEWCTQSENIKHAYDSLGFIPHWRGKTGKLSRNSKPVVAVCLQSGAMWNFDSGSDAIRCGIAKDSSGIASCCNGKLKKHNGYVWSYV